MTYQCGRDTRERGLIFSKKKKKIYQNCYLGRYPNKGDEEIGCGQVADHQRYPGFPVSSAGQCHEYREIAYRRDEEAYAVDDYNAQRLVREEHFRRHCRILHPVLVARVRKESANDTISRKWIETATKKE